MSAYHQMGHDSWNLIGEEALRSFKGLVLSPVNDGPAVVVEKLASLDPLRSQLDILLDPQFYKPGSDRGSLQEWAHIPRDFGTADVSDIGWWGERCRLLAAEAEQIGATSVASPAVIPRAFTPDYYDWVVNCAELLAGATRASVLLTVIVRLSDISELGAVERIASILTRTQIDRIYLVLYDDVPPRSQRTDVEALAGALSLIRMLEKAGSRVIVAFSGLDMLLWKEAGATAVATGKFFNLRRFVPGRWEDPSEGGRVLPYWTDDELITWLREDDVRLLLRLGIIDGQRASGSNPYSQEILSALERRGGEAWVRWGWRQYLYWFNECEAALDAKKVSTRDILGRADRHWSEVERRGALLFERANNGEWIRAWLNALLF